MIISSLRLVNFRQYLGDNELTFSTDPEKNLTIVTGDNGTGKTGIFIALNWCLYGVLDRDSGGLLSKGLSEEARAEGGFIEVQFRHDATQYVARRAIEAVGPSQEKSGLLSLRRLAGSNAKLVPNPVQQMNEILPEDARRYFFFDGERINDLTKAGHEAQVRDAMHSVLKLKILERTIAHLGVVEKEYAAEIRQSGALDNETKGLLAEIEGVRVRIEELVSQRNQAQEELDKCEEQIAAINEAFLSIEAVSRLVAEEAQIDAKLAALDARSGSLTAAMRDLVARSGPGFASPAIEIANAILDDKRKRGEVPSNVRHQLIDDLLKAGNCICDRPLDAGARQALASRLKGAASEEMEDMVIQAAGHIGALRGLSSDIPTQIADQLGGFEDMRSDMDDLQRKRDAIRRGMSVDLKGKAPQEIIQQVQDLSKNRQHLETRRGDLKYDLGKHSQLIAHFESEEGQLRQELQRSASMASAASRGARRYEIAVQARQAAETLLNTFFEDMRGRIEKTTDEVFKSLLRKKKQFTQVKIHDDCRIDVIDRFGTSALQQLSEGEGQVLSLSFIVAMARVTGEEAPLVIDNPFGRLGKTVLGNIAREIPDIAGQMILLVLDSGLDPKARELMEHRIGYEYFLEFDDDEGATTISEVDTG